MKLQILLLALALPCTSLFSQTTYTWDGGGGDQLWNTATNWNPDGVPGALNNVVINNGFIVNVNVNAVMNNFDFTNPNGGAYLVGSGSLTINGTFNMLGNVGTSGGVTINGTLNWDYTFQGSGIVNCNGTTNVGATFAAATSGMIVKLYGGGNWINDAVQYGDGRQYAGVGSLGGKPALFMVNWETQQFSQPVVTQGFLQGVTTLKGVCALANGQGFGVVGTEFTASGIRMYIAKLDAGGSIVWEQTYDDYTIGSDIVATPDGGMLVGGQETCDNLACNYPVLYKLDSNGDFE